MKAKARGYTIIEVMMALAVLAVGASGVIAMQKATLISNVNSRNLATATAIAQTWMERMRADAIAWNDQGGVPDIADSQWLNLATVGGTGSGWKLPGKSNFAGSKPAGVPAADVLGADVYSTGQTASDPFPTAFCTEVRLTRLANQTTGALAPMSPLIRVEVRTYWARNGQPLDCTVEPAAVAPATTFEASTGAYGFVYLVSAVMKNGSPL